jgi:diguanylate cyclase (GGDEF)-like protein
LKHSINKIFNNLSKYLLVISFFGFVVVFLLFEQDISYSKIDNLKNQQVIVNSLANLKQTDIELALIQFNGKSTQLEHEMQKLRMLDKYHFTSKYLLKNSDEYLSDVDKLSKLTTKFNSLAHEYYIKNLKNVEQKTKELKNTFYSVKTHLDSMILKNITYNEEEFNLLKKTTYLLLLFTVLTTFWYRKRFKAIYSDILYLYAIDKDKKNYEIFSEEVDAIKLRMNRKPVVTDNPAMLDPVTQINNHKGMMSSYSQKRGIKDSNFTSVTILEIDNFSKQKRAFSQEFTQAILKKVAFTISLHEQATDVIARTDYNQFTIILSRTSKEQSFKDIDIIRQSISEIKFKAPTGNIIIITVSGGFIIKPNNQSLEESIRRAKEVLQHSKEKGTNSISQTMDLAEQDL